jgi:hypothetical protein
MITTISMETEREIIANLLASERLYLRIIEFGLSLWPTIY